ncbi:MAG: trehalose-phosphatase [Phycisphaerales bacterium]
MTGAMEGVGADPALSVHLARLARVPVLLIASDYDGTLSPIVSDPAAAMPDRESMVALKGLAELPGTHVAVVSGRSLADLADLTGAPDNVRLVGSHGSEFDVDYARSLAPEVLERRAKVLSALREIASRDAGLSVEEKPASVALHYRNAPADVGERALADALSGPGSAEGVQVKRGKMVVELAVVHGNKGAALETLRSRVGASAVLFVGDDVTDEDAFATLAGPDVGVKVGDGESVAAFRVGTTRDVSRLLAELCELRALWAAGAEAVPIEDHAMLTDQRTIALVAPGARVVWMCPPRIDASALFAELLGGEPAGRFVVCPAGDNVPEPDVGYEPDTFHLRTSWPGLTVTDWLDCSGERPANRAGRTDLVRVLEGSGRARVEFAPRLDFGRVPTRLETHEDGLAVDDAFDPIVLRSPGVSWEIRDEGMHQTAVAEIDLQEGEPVVLEMRYGTGSLRASRTPVEGRSAESRRYWSDWAAGLSVPGVAPELVRRSALVLRGLWHRPTGAIAAAGTTSLPEWIGGVRNWDYRYCWPRDAAMAARALVDLGSTREALKFLDWLMLVMDQAPAKDRIMPIYTVAGGMLHAEAEIGELSGYAGSRPVRVGNAASRQVQLDVFGPIVELVHRLVEVGAAVTSDHVRAVEAAVEAVMRHWDEPDHGIWEIRAPKRHHVHSRVMCWQTVRLGIEIMELFRGKTRPEWAACRDAIRADVLENGWNEGLGAFTTAYGHDDFDAAVLTVGLTGMLESDDPRWTGTVEAVEEHLRGGPTVWRYHTDDGLPGAEGGFNLCTAWLIQSYVLCGRAADARELFDSYVTLCGQTGLIPEEFDPVSGRGLGNHPQAYSHIGLIESAFAIDELGA